jgi:hypothetical protein
MKKCLMNDFGIQTFKPGSQKEFLRNQTEKLKISLQAVFCQNKTLNLMEGLKKSQN